MAHLPLSPEQMLRLIAEDALDAFIILDADNRVAAWSPYAETLFGWHAEEALGKCLNELIIPPQLHTAHSRGIEQYLKYGKLTNLRRRVEVTALHKDRHPIDIELTVTPIHLNNQIYFTASIRDNSERKKIREQLQEQAALLDLTRDAVIVLSPKDEILWWNHGAELMFGFTKEEAIGHIHYELLSTRFPIPPGKIKHELTTNRYWEGELVHRKADGSLITTHSRCVVEGKDQKQPSRILVTATDITLQKQARTQQSLLHIFEQRFNSLFESYPDGVFALNAQSRLVSANPALAALTGYSIEELITTPRARVIAPEDLQRVSDLTALALKGNPQHCEADLIKKDSTRCEVLITLVPIMVDGDVHGVHGLVKDISKQKEFERRIHYRANHDQLTGLPNRNLLEDRIKHAMEQARRSGSQAGILFMDLNRFKFVNDNLGHEAGDMLLQVTADRLKHSIREVDTVARIGGDEFVVLLENIHPDANDISIVAHNLIKAVSQPVNLSGHELTISTSIGASIFPLHGTDLHTLIKAADQAMYKAKASGPGNFELYTDVSGKDAQHGNASVRSLRRALENNELTLHYQPRFDLATQTVTGIEALLRWEHPEKGLIYPESFIGEAESAGMIGCIDEWVLHTACLHNKLLQESGIPPLKVSVNLSLQTRHFVDIYSTVHNALKEAGLNAQYLEVDFSERQLIHDQSYSTKLLSQLSDLGITIAMDDFGTGRCPITDLKQLSINSLKIHESFVQDVSSQSDNASIVSATISMAHSMGMNVIAEGVTSDEEMHFLKEHGCDQMQGYLACMPLPFDEAKEFLIDLNKQKNARLKRAY